jgi:hypothetical protein
MDISWLSFFLFAAGHDIYLSSRMETLKSAHEGELPFSVLNQYLLNFSIHDLIELAVNNSRLEKIYENVNNCSVRCLLETKSHWRDQILPICQSAGITVEENFKQKLLKNSNQWDWLQIAKKWGAPYVRWSRMQVCKDILLGEREIASDILSVTILKPFILQISCQNSFQFYNCEEIPTLYLEELLNEHFECGNYLVSKDAASKWVLCDKLSSRTM